MQPHSKIIETSNKELDDMLVRYLQLCEAFRDSDIWSNEAKQAIELFNRGDKIISRQCPVIALYRPLCNAVKLLGEIMEGRCLDDSVYKDVWTCANLIWCGMDGDTSVKNVLTHNNPIEVNMWITE